MKSTNNAVRCSLQLLQLSTPIGPVKVTGCDQGIHEIKLTPTDKAPCGKLRSVTIDGEERKQDLSGPLKECLGWLESFFKDASSIASLPLPPLHMTGIKSGSFMDKVLHSLDDIVPVGKTITYKNLAIEMENPRAARAVGLAMARNPLPIVIPCHRVTSSDGTLNKYISGVCVKRWLLEHEGAI
ncbi:methylated-DNA--protein-cysteine methyltransferase-like isoform X2 [Apostichopus japonicus]|uniref:methylated-DNA--protein-cysteine methyltransferase-like isoform X2 n=1 Tax=Stichopus japonicus TaxID=307972 RepID=UPI003AB83464